MWSWALYDWANSAFATTVMAGFFPLFFKEYWSSTLSASQSTYYLGLSNSGASLLVALAAPLLGAVADQGQSKKIFLAMFTILGAGSTMALWRVEQGQFTLAAGLYAVASFAFAAALTFYDALLLRVSTAQKYDLVSGLGYALGYLGGGLLFAINVWMYLKPEVFGLSTGAQGVRWSFFTVGVWWIVFSIPLFLFVRESPQTSSLSLKVVRQGFVQYISTFKKLSKIKPILYFLLAYLLYIDGVNTIIKMAVDYGLSIGFESKHLITALLIVQFVGFPAAVGFGFLGQKYGPRPGILLGLGVYVLVTVFAYFMTTPLHFYILAIVIGLVQGGVQSLSRSYFARLIPQGQEGEFFGFFNMLGKFGAIFGPVLVGIVSVSTNDPRLSILVLIFMFVGGAVLLSRLKN